MGRTHSILLPGTPLPNDRFLGSTCPNECAFFQGTLLRETAPSLTHT